MNRTCHELGVCNSRPDQDGTCSHDTEKLPPGGIYFAPGAIEGGPTRKRTTLWRRLVLEAIAVLAVAGCIGFVAGMLQAKGWPL